MKCCSELIFEQYIRSFNCCRVVLSKNLLTNFNQLSPFSFFNPFSSCFTASVHSLGNFKDGWYGTANICQIPLKFIKNWNFSHLKHETVWFVHVKLINSSAELWILLMKISSQLWLGQQMTSWYTLQFTLSMHQQQSRTYIP